MVLPPKPFKRRHDGGDEDDDVVKMVKKADLSREVPEVKKKKPPGVSIHRVVSVPVLSLWI